MAGDPAAGLPYQCAGHPFDVRGFSLPPTAHLADDDAAAALRQHFGPDVARRGWWLTHRSATEAEFLTRNGPELFEYVLFQRRADGSWAWRGEGDCETQFRVLGLITLPWLLDDSVPLKPGTQLIRAILVDRCDVEPLPGRIQPPIVRVAADSVLVIFTALPDAPAAGRHGRLVRRGGARSEIVFEPICAPGPPLEVDVDLGQPLGDRLLLDGATWPARDARLPLKPWRG